MNGRWAVALLFLIPAVAPVASAMEMAEVPLLTDPVDDVFASTPAGGASASGVRYKGLDLTSYAITEGDDQFTFTLGLNDLDDPGELLVHDDSVYYFGFNKGDQSYLVQMFRALAEQQYWWGTYLKFDPEQQGFTFIRPLVHRVDIATDFGADTIAVTLEREEILDTLGASPSPGNEITNFWAFAHLRTAEGFINLGNVGGNPITVGQGVDAWDAMPDDGVGVGSYEVQLGLLQEGNAALATVAPMRASNGEASTFVFSLVAENRGATTDVFELTTGGVPSAWDVVIPDQFLTLEAGEVREIPVLVTTPFAHRHGEVETFRVEMQSQTDQGTGRMDLGIRYHAVPQPAGHHNTLHFHSQRWGEANPLFPVTDAIGSGNGGQFYVNTLEDDANDQRVAVTANYQGYGFHNGFPQDTTPQSLWQWGVWLQPGLEMGLDFDLNGVGTLSTMITSTHVVPQASVGGRLLHWGYDDVTDTWTPTTVAQLPPTPPTEILSGSTTPFSWEFTIEPDADLLEYTPRAFFGVILNLTSPRPSLFTGIEAPQMAPGGIMTLPMHEYRDPVDDLFASVGSVLFHADGPQQKQVNPGESVILRSTLMNHLDEPVEFQLRYDGVNTQWARLLGPQTVRLEPNQGTSIAIGVQIPADAQHGDAVDVVVSAQSVRDPAVRTLVRLVAAVDTGADHLDETGDLDLLSGTEVKESPLGVFALLAAVGAALVARRRRF